MRLAVWRCFRVTRFLFENAVDDTHELLKCGPAWWDISPGYRRGRVVQHLADRVPVQPVHPGGFPNAHIPPPSPPGEPADRRPRCTSVAPSVWSATTLVDGGGRSNFQPPFVLTSSNYPPAGDTFPPPITGVDMAEIEYNALARACLKRRITEEDSRHKTSAPMRAIATRRQPPSTGVSLQK